MTDRYHTTRGRGGQVYQAGLDVRSRDAPLPMQPRRGPYRAVVLNTYVTDTTGRGPRQKTAQVTCDVILCLTGARLNNVPVAQPEWGENDARAWVPKESTRVISQNTTLNADTLRTARGSFQGPITPIDDLDGDNVLLDFIEGSHRQPIILRAIPHEQTKRLIIEGTGHTDAPNTGDNTERGRIHRRESYTRHAGTEFRINAVGDVLLDTVGATDDRVEQDPSKGDSSGHVRIRMKDSRRFVVEMDGTDVLEIWKDGGQVRIDLGEGAAERLLLGDAFRSWLNDWITDIFEGHQHEVGTLTTTGAITGQTGKVASVAIPPAPPILTYLGTSLGTDVLSDLAFTKKS